MSLTLTSTAFDDGGEIPSVYTCDGEDVTPPLKWGGVPEDARSLVLIVDDPDAPDPAAPKMTWVHWLVYNIPPDTFSLEDSGHLPGGAGEGLNDWRRLGYGGPCPPRGRHRYFFKLYALDTTLESLKRPRKAELESAMRGHILDSAELVGTYSK